MRFGLLPERRCLVAPDRHPPELWSLGQGVRRSLSEVEREPGEQDTFEAQPIYGSHERPLDAGAGLRHHDVGWKNLIRNLIWER